MLAATFPHDHTLASARELLGIELPETERSPVDDEMIFYPKSEEDLEEMMRIIEAQEARGTRQ